MSSAQKIAANRRNAQYSTGPKSANGKARSRYNAVKSGIYSPARLLPGEDGKAYQQLKRRLHERYAPTDPVEELLVDQMLGHIWRIGRSERAEHAFLEKMIEPRVSRNLPCSHTVAAINSGSHARNGQLASVTDNQSCDACRKEKPVGVSAPLGAALFEAAIPAHELNPLLRLGAQRRAELQDILFIQEMLDAAWANSFARFSCEPGISTYESRSKAPGVRRRKSSFGK